MRRREFALALPALAWAVPGFALPAIQLAFPRDHGSHPAQRTEWWYITGSAKSGEREFGFQVTFFRTRVEAAQTMASRFAAKQLVFAHAALTDVQGRTLLHDQRIAREGFDIATAAEGDARVRLRDWSLVRTADAYLAKVASGDFSLDLRCAPTQPLLLQGKAGLSRKGPLESQASYYYSEPQLAVAGSIVLRGKRLSIEGRAWLDHEWSDQLLHSDAVGWDWIGMNLDDGSALTAFRLRRQDGSTLWDGGSFRARGGSTYVFSQGEVVFSPQRKWTSPASGATYPVEWMVRTPADFYTVKALVDNQELDSRASTGAIYWEGLSELFDSNGKRVGRGYLEMTGYSKRLKL
ncbi:lipocalin-like domain-containing protein [Caenimonas koreensis]|uniref:Carotenoid 1,2-hydratase n=1 Tax=Caenimonas koreensis DSM 17982 TaxID=1121255 RepID=A0A844B938_9BURK|nr:carotenoid 1,2-hydratase [Caenimonas koreensis]MRD47986.1 carotenoid 1,2-hydratase [Caenimonas koreensis DSM 17982]